jgi:hypothetical protein
MVAVRAIRRPLDAVGEIIAKMRASGNRSGPSAASLEAGTLSP